MSSSVVSAPARRLVPAPARCEIRHCTQAAALRRRPVEAPRGGNVSSAVPDRARHDVRHRGAFLGISRRRGRRWISGRAALVLSILSVAVALPMALIARLSLLAG